MNAQIDRGGDRVSLMMPVEVTGKDINGHQFVQRTRTLVISRYGASVAIGHELAPKQELVIHRPGIEKKAAAQVVRKIGGGADEHVYGLILLDPSINLWDIEFPPAAESEKAIARALLECCCCQSREVAYLNEIEFKAFISDQNIARYCRACGVSTTWTQGLHDLFSKRESRSVNKPRTEDRRKETRSKVNPTACIRHPGFAEEIVFCENMSHGGLSFKGKKRYPEGSRIEVAVPYSAKAANIFVPAWIVYSKELPRGDIFRHGVAYRIREFTPSH